MKIAVTGGGGQLAQVLRKHIDKKHNYYFLNKNELDIGNRKLLKTVFDKIKPNIIINMAAYTSVDQAEFDEDAAFFINSTSVGYLAEYCSENNIILIHISTDYVYGNNSSFPNEEINSTKPENVYGKSKLSGEQLIENLCKKYLIIRTSWLFSEYGSNFVKTIINLYNTQKKIDVVSDQFGAPTSCYSLISVLFKIIYKIDNDFENLAWGIYNYSDYPNLSWFDFSKAIISRVEEYNSKDKFFITPISSNEYKSKAIRPMNSRLNCKKIMKEFNIEQFNWNHDLDYVVKKIIGKDNENN